MSTSSAPVKTSIPYTRQSSARFVLVDNSVYELSSNPEVEKGRVAIREAVAAE